MPNITASYGFRIYRDRGSTRAAFDPIEMHVADAYQASINGGGNVHLGVGDVVKYTAAGGVSLADGTEGASGAELPYGVIVGVKQYYDGTVVRSGQHIPGGSTGGGIYDRRSSVLVLPANACWWEVEVDENTTATTRAAYQALVHRNVDIINTEANTRATPKLDISGHNTTATLGWRIMEVSKSTDMRDFSAVGVRLVVASNASSLAGVAARPVVGV